MTEEFSCIKCGCFIVRTVGHYMFDKSKDIEVEEIKCLKCGFISKIPLQNKMNQLRVNMEELNND